MTSLSADQVEMQRAVRGTLAAHWRLLVFQGVVLVLLGILAVVEPVVATITVDFFVGWLFVVSGLVGLAVMVSARNVQVFLWTLLTAALSLVAGILLVWKPVQGAVSLTAVLTAFFIVEGIFQTVASIAYRDVMTRTWGWMLLSGLSDLALAAIIILGWPGTAAWTLGLLVGINLITSGWAILMVAFAARGFVHAVTSAPATSRS